MGVAVRGMAYCLSVISLGEKWELLTDLMLHLLLQIPAYIAYIAWNCASLGFLCVRVCLSVSFNGHLQGDGIECSSAIWDKHLGLSWHVCDVTVDFRPITISKSSYSVTIVAMMPRRWRKLEFSLLGQYFLHWSWTRVMASTFLHLIRNYPTQLGMRRLATQYSHWGEYGGPCWTRRSGLCNAPVVC